MWYKLGYNSSSVHRDLMSWINGIRGLVSSEELAKDVTGAEALLERHQVLNFPLLYYVQYYIGYCTSNAAPPIFLSLSIFLISLTSSAGGAFFGSHFVSPVPASWLIIIVESVFSKSAS